MTDKAVTRSGRQPRLHHAALSAGGGKGPQPTELRLFLRARLYADVGYASPTNPHHHHVEGEVSAVGGEEECGGEDDADSREGLPEPAVPFRTALMLPGVITYAMALFFSKLIAYTFLYWLPFYVGSTGASKAPPKLRATPMRVPPTNMHVFCPESVSEAAACQRYLPVGLHRLVLRLSVLSRGDLSHRLPR